MSPVVRAPALSFIDCKVAYFQTKTAEMTLKDNRGHWRWQSSTGHEDRRTDR